MSDLSRNHYTHPIRTLPILSYQGDHDCIALIGHGKKASFPLFRGETREQAEVRAEEWRQAVIRDHEEAFSIRQEKAEKMRTKRASKGD